MASRAPNHEGGIAPAFSPAGLLGDGAPRPVRADVAEATLALAPALTPPALARVLPPLFPPVLASVLASVLPPAVAAPVAAPVAWALPRCRAVSPALALPTRGSA